MATHSSVLAWRVPWTEELGRFQSLRFQQSDTTCQLNHQQQQRTSQDRKVKAPEQATQGRLLFENAFRALQEAIYTSFRRKALNIGK